MKKWVVANWKMNGNKTLCNVYEAKFKNTNNLIVCPPFVYLNKCSIIMAGQNVHHLSTGAYTGEVSAPMLADIGIKYCLIGHSERRHFFGETDNLIKIKAIQCNTFGIIPIICVGESLEDYMNGNTSKVLATQLQNCLPGSSNFWLAYEPLWAIGTGKTPSISEITQLHNMLRQELPEIVLLYGGSVNASNAKEILAIQNVDGVLVGGASLNINAISTIYDCA